MPIYLLKVSKRSKDLLRIEKKLDFLSHHINNLGIYLLAKPLSELIQVQALNSNLNQNFQEQFKSDLINLISSIERSFENQFLQFESLLSIYNSLPNLKLLPATRGWAGSPDFLSKIIEVIHKEKPHFVLETGSGVSTLIVGLAMKLNNDGKIISLDHEQSYTKTTIEYSHVNEIADISNIIYSPLKDYNILGQTWKWYETDNLKFSEKIDLLIIDGPPKSTQFLARYPAVPLLHAFFSDRILILLDDANRNDEVVTVQKWIKFLEDNNFKVVVTKFNNFEKGMVILEVCRLK